MIFQPQIKQQATTGHIETTEMSFTRRDVNVALTLAINSILMSLLAWTTGLIVPRAASAMYAMVGAMIGSWNATELNSENYYLQLIEGDIERRTVAESQRQVYTGSLSFCS